MQRLRGRQHLHARQGKKQMQRLRGRQHLHARQAKKPMQRLRSISIVTTIASLSLFDAAIAFCQRAEGCGAADAAKRRRLSLLRAIAYSSIVHCCLFVQA